jgi:hypothetical protein
VGTKDIPRMVAGFKSAIGKKFTAGETMEEQQKTVQAELTRAGQAARAGYFDSPDQYIEARGALASVGGDGDDLEKIMRNAVAAGMDSSKNIMEMVGAVTSLNQRSADQGIDATAGMIQQYGKAVTGLTQSGVDENVAARAALRAATTAENVAQSGELDMFNLMEWSELSNTFEGAKMFEMEAMQTASPAEIRSLMELQKAGKTDEAQEAANKMGLGRAELGIATDPSKAQQLLDISRRQQMKYLTGLGMEPEIAGQLWKAQEDNVKYKDLTDTQKSMLGAQGKARGISGAAYYESLRTGEQDLGDIRKAPGGTTEYGGERKLQGMSQADVKIFAEGAKMLRDAGQTWADRAQMGAEVSKGLTVADYARQTAEAAAKMSAPIDTFATNLEAFNTTVSEFTTRIDGVIGKMETIINQGKKGDNGLTPQAPVKPK